jgi:AraC-like DNA-binding protein
MWHLFEQTVSGIEGWRTAIWGSDLDATQLKRGRAEGHLVHAVLDGPALSFGEIARPVTARLRGPIAPGCICLGTHLDQKGSAYHCGTKTLPGDISVYRAGGEYDAYLTAGLSYATLTIPVSMATEFTRAVIPSAAPLLETSLTWQSSPPARHLIINSMRGALATIRQLSVTPPPYFNPRSFALALFASLIEPLDTRKREDRGNYAPADYRLVRAVEDLLQCEEVVSLSLPDLCFELGMSRRTIERAFQRVLDISPAHYLMLFRLCRAREDLIAGHETVSSIAMKHGFFELGRFAGKYRDIFGELPSETLAMRRHDRKMPVTTAVRSRGLQALSKRLSNARL